jgi:hypothetical protein
MSGNSADVLTVRVPGSCLTGDNTPCDVCGGHLADHEWADVYRDENGTVVDCSGEARAPPALGQAPPVHPPDNPSSSRRST